MLAFVVLVRLLTRGNATAGSSRSGTPKRTSMMVMDNADGIQELDLDLTARLQAVGAPNTSENQSPKRVKGVTASRHLSGHLASHMLSSHSSSFSALPPSVISSASPVTDPAASYHIPLIVGSSTRHGLQGSDLSSTRLNNPNLSSTASGQAVGGMKEGVISSATAASPRNLKAEVEAAHVLQYGAAPIPIHSVANELPSNSGPLPQQPTLSQRLSVPLLSELGPLPSQLLPSVDILPDFDVGSLNPGDTQYGASAFSSRSPFGPSPTELPIFSPFQNNTHVMGSLEPNLSDDLSISSFLPFDDLPGPQDHKR